MRCTAIPEKALLHWNATVVTLHTSRIDRCSAGEVTGRRHGDTGRQWGARGRSAAAAEAAARLPARHRLQLRPQVVRCAAMQRFYGCRLGLAVCARSLHARSHAALAPQRQRSGASAERRRPPRAPRSPPCPRSCSRSVATAAMDNESAEEAGEAPSGPVEAENHDDLAGQVRAGLLHGRLVLVTRRNGRQTPMRPRLRHWGDRRGPRSRVWRSTCPPAACSAAPASRARSATTPGPCPAPSLSYHLPGQRRRRCPAGGAG